MVSTIFLYGHINQKNSILTIINIVQLSVLKKLEYLERNMNNRAYYFDYLRVIAILGVIVIHVAAAYVVMYLKIPMIQWEASVVFNGLVRWCVPIFFMVSGALLLGRKEEPLGMFFKRRANRILLPFMIWTVVYYIWRQYFWYGGTLDVLELGRLFLNNQVYYHLWYLYALIGIYLLVPVLNVFVNHAKLQVVGYISLMWGIAYCGFRYFGYEVGNVFVDFFPLSNYVGMVIVGYYFSRVELSRKWRYAIYVAGIVGVLLTIRQTFSLTNNQGVFSSYAMQYESPFVMATAIALFVWFRYVIGGKQEKNPDFKPSRLVQVISRLSFGIYLLHVLLLDMVRKFFHDNGEVLINPIIGMPLQLVLVLTITTVLVWIIEKIPYIRRVF